MILRGSVFSNQLEMDSGITIVTPANYRPGKAYQVCYLLHGLLSNNSDTLDYTMLPVYANKHHCIIVMPEVGRSFYTDMKNGQNYFSYITKELPEICQNVFNISSKPEDTFVVGISMGGYGALKCALTFPEKYGMCYAISPGCLFLKDFLRDMKEKQNDKDFIGLWGKQMIKDFQGAFGEELLWSPEIELGELAKKLSTNSDTAPVIHSVCGTEDPLLGLNRQFSELMKNVYPKFTYEEWGGNHNWQFFNEALQKALDFCCKA